MTDNKIVKLEPAQPAREADLAELTRRTLDMLSAMGEMLRATNDRMTALEREMRRLQKVTPAQASAINAAIRARASELCRVHRCAGQEKKAAAAIRKGLRLTTGVNGVRELPRADYQMAMDCVKMWDDYGVMKGLRMDASAKA